MELINLKDLNLSTEESRDILKFIAQKRGISTKQLLSTIKPNPKRKNNEILTTKPLQKVVKNYKKWQKKIQKVVKTQQKVVKTQQKVVKTQQKLAKTQQKVAKLKLAYEKPLKLAKRENLTPQKPLKTTKQQILSKTKKRIEIIREKLKELRHKLSKSELGEIKKHLYNIENKKELLESETTKKYLDELDKKFLKLDEYHDDDDFEFRRIENVQDLFKMLIYKPTLVKSGYNNNYIQYESKGDNVLTVEEYLALIEPYLIVLINYYKNKSEWKIQLTAQINFISLKPDSDETRVMHTKSDNKEFMNGSHTDEIVKELFKSLLQRHQKNVQEKMRGSDFAFDGINFLYYDFNKISISRGGSYIDSPKWLKNKKSTINPNNNDYKCFQYAVTLALNLDKINDHPERISKIKPFIEQYNWKDIDFPSTSKA